MSDLGKARIDMDFSYQARLAPTLLSRDRETNRRTGGAEMRVGPQSRRRAWRWLTTLSGAVVCGAAIAAGTSGGARDVADAWTALIEAADQGGLVDLPQSRGGTRLTARQAYLLAFHEAQDAGDPEHVLAVADRLDSIGEGALASHVRWAARVLLAELGAGDGLDGDPEPPPWPRARPGQEPR